MRHETNYVWLDFVRGVSALLVCLSHVRNGLIVDYSTVANPTWPQKVFYLLSGVGHEAVIVFFVLSGFFVGGGLVGAHLRDRFNWRSYLLARLTRLWIVLIPALALTYAIDLYTLSSDIDAFSGKYRSIWGSGPWSPQPYSAEFHTLIGNLLFLQTIFVPVYGSNGPLWSLANEFWYYILFPLCFSAFCPNLCAASSKTARILSLMVVTFMLYLLPATIDQGFIIWLLGLAVYYCKGRISTYVARLGCWVGLAATFSTVLISKAQTGKLQWPFLSDLSMGVLFFVLTASLVNLNSRSSMVTKLRLFSKSISNISFSLYLSHFPILAAVLVRVYKGTKLQPDLIGVAHVFVCTAMLAGFGAIFWLFVERQTDLIKVWLEEKI